MPVVVGTVAEIGLDYLGFAGRVGRRGALTFPERVRPESLEVGVRWITVFEPAADFSNLDDECLQGIKARLRPVVASLRAKGPFRMIMVSSSEASARLIERWRSITVADPTYPSDPEGARSIEEACIRHGLAAGEAVAVKAEIERDFRDAMRL